MPWSEPASASPAMLFAIVVVAMLVSVLGSAWAISHAHRNDLLDQPGERRSHDVPTPRGGGIGIVVASLLALVAICATTPIAASWLLVAAGLLLVASIGWWDDHRPLPAWPRLLVHAMAAACLAGALLLQGAAPIAAIAAFLFAIVLVNAWNFMDGINGLATSQALLSAAGFAAVLGEGWRLLALVVAASCLGFLPFNFPRAKVFLGDVGSGALGYLVAVLLAAGFASRPLAGWFLWLLPPLAMLADTGLTLLWRVRRGERWWQAHVLHVFQRWSRRLGHVRVCMAYAIWTFMAVAVMLCLQRAAVEWQLAVGLGGLLTACLVWSRLHKGLP